MWSLRLKLSFPLSVLAVFAVGCSTFPEPTHEDFEYPKENVYVKNPTKKFKKIGVVRSKVNFETLDPTLDVEKLCKNYYNKSVKELLKFAKKAGGDAVMDVKSVVFFMDGKMETYERPECADDGLEAQILTRGVAIKWIEEGPESESKTE